MAEARTTIAGLATSGLAGRYATALFELARDASALPAVDAGLARFAAALAASPDLASVMLSPRLARDTASSVLASVAKQLELDGLTSNFIGTLARNRRLPSFAAIHAGFIQLMAHYRGETSALVTSAHPLSDAQLTALKAKLRAGLGQDVALQTKVDPGILGGLIVKVGSRLIDSSLKTKLDSLTVAMKG